MKPNLQAVQQRDWQAIVRQQVESLEFGVVQIVVHGARVVQIERTEKVRLDDRAQARSDSAAA